MIKKALKYYTNGGSILGLSLLGMGFGYLFPNYVDFLKPIGMLFIQLIKMLLIPIIFITVLNAVVSIKSEGKIAKLGSFIFSYFFLTSFFAGLLGVGIALFFQVGSGIGELPKELLNFDMGFGAAEEVVNPSFWAFIFNVIPTNPFLAMSEGKLLSVVFFTVFLGIGLFNIKHPAKQTLIDTIGVLSDTLMWMIAKIMYLAPIAVFCLMAYLIGTMGFEILFLVGKLIGTVILVDFIWIYLVLAVLVALFSKISYKDFIKKILPVQLVSFSTASSLVTLPTNLKACENMKLNKHVASFLLPLGATLNMNGSSLFYGIVTVFFAQMFGVELTLSSYILIALMATLGSMSTPGVPGLSLTIIMVMAVVNVPLIGLPLIFAIDRILDMFTTTVNVVGDAAGVAIADNLVENAE